MKKKITYLLLFMFMLAAVPATANAASAKDSVKKTVTNYMKAAKKFDTAKMNKYVSEKGDKLTKEALNATPNAVKYIKLANKKISCKITKVDVKGKNATVTAKITYVNSKPVTDAMVDQMMADALAGKGIYSSLENITNEAKMIEYVDSLYAMVLAKDIKLDTQTKTVKIKMTKKGNDWKFKNMSKSNKELWDIVNGAVGDAMNKSTSNMSTNPFGATK